MNLTKFVIEPKEYDELAELSIAVINTRERYPDARNAMKRLLKCWTKLGRKYGFNRKTAEMQTDAHRNWAVVTAEKAK